MFGVVLLCIGFFVGCWQDMYDMLCFEVMEENDFFVDRCVMCLQVEGIVVCGFLQDDEVFYMGKVDGELIVMLFVSFMFDQVFVDCGESCFNIYCLLCYLQFGDGNGMVVQCGYKWLMLFYDVCLKVVLFGYFYDVMMNGFGQMLDYLMQVVLCDCWVIVVYICVLQFSQDVIVIDVLVVDCGVFDGLKLGVVYEGGVGYE